MQENRQPTPQPTGLDTPTQPRLSGSTDWMTQLTSVAKVGLTVVGALGLWGSVNSPATTAAVVFGQQEVNQERFIVIASPFRGGTAHQLLILEQVSNQRPCWAERGSNPTLVDPLLLNFNFTGICGRSTDSNGYSIRMAGQDLALQYRLSVVHRGNDLVLVGMPTMNPKAPTLELGRANGMTNDFAKIQLTPGWRLTRRTSGSQPVGHIYLTTNQTPPMEIASQLPPPGPVTPPSTSAPSTRPSPSPSPAIRPRPKPPTPSPKPTPLPVQSTPKPTVKPSPKPVSSPRPTTAKAPFADLKDDIYAVEIRQAVATGLISGFYEDNTFRPEVPLTREQLVSMVIETLKKLPNAPVTLPTQVTAAPYPDVPATRWSASKIQFSRDRSIISGYQDGTFQPEKPVTRAELVVVLRRAAQFYRSSQNLSTQLPAGQPVKGFTDIDTHWAAGIIKEMATYCKVASPVNEQGTTFYPNGPALRNYAAAAALRMFNCAKASKR